MKKIIASLLFLIPLIQCVGQGTLQRITPTTSQFSREAFTNETAAGWRAKLGVGSGGGGGGSTNGGTVTSVALTMPSPFTVIGSPVTDNGTITVGLPSQSANTFFGAPSGIAGAPGFRALTSTDIPSLDAAKITTGVFPPARLAAGAPSSANYLRGDGAWSTVNGANIDVGSITASQIDPTLDTIYRAGGDGIATLNGIGTNTTLRSADINDISLSVFSHPSGNQNSDVFRVYQKSGNPALTVSAAGSVTANGTLSGTFTGNGAGLTNINGANIQLGTISSNKLDSTAWNAFTSIAEATNVFKTMMSSNNTFFGNGAGITNLNLTSAYSFDQGGLQRNMSNAMTFINVMDYMPANPTPAQTAVAIQTAIDKTTNCWTMAQTAGFYGSPYFGTNSHSVVYFPNGSYYVDRPLRVRTGGTKFVGEGPYSRVKIYQTVATNLWQADPWGWTEGGGNVLWYCSWDGFDMQVYGGIAGAKIDCFSFVSPAGGYYFMLRRGVIKNCRVNGFYNAVNVINGVGLLIERCELRRNRRALSLTKCDNVMVVNSSLGEGYGGYEWGETNSTTIYWDGNTNGPAFSLVVIGSEAGGDNHFLDARSGDISIIGMNYEVNNLGAPSPATNYGPIIKCSSGVFSLSVMNWRSSSMNQYSVGSGTAAREPIFSFSGGTGKRALIQGTSIDQPGGIGANSYPIIRLDTAGDYVNVISEGLSVTNTANGDYYNTPRIHEGITPLVSLATNNASSLTNIYQRALGWAAGSAGNILYYSSSNTAYWAAPPAGGSGTGIQTNGGSGVNNTLSNLTVTAIDTTSPALTVVPSAGQITSPLKVQYSGGGNTLLNLGSDGSLAIRGGYFGSGVGLTNIPEAAIATNTTWIAPSEVFQYRNGTPLVPTNSYDLFQNWKTGKPFYGYHCFDTSGFFKFFKSMSINGKTNFIVTQYFSTTGATYQATSCRANTYTLSGGGVAGQYGTENVVTTMNPGGGTNVDTVTYQFAVAPAESDGIIDFQLGRNNGSPAPTNTVFWLGAKVVQY